MGCPLSWVFFSLSAIAVAWIVCATASCSPFRQGLALLEDLGSQLDRQADVLQLEDRRNGDNGTVMDVDNGAHLVPVLGGFANVPMTSPLPIGDLGVGRQRLGAGGRTELLDVKLGARVYQTQDGESLLQLFGLTGEQKVLL